MVKLNKIYTKTGDAGETGLVGGVRVAKQSVRVEAYGTVDEANSVIGLVRLYTQGAYDAMLKRIQHDLFDLGADLATPYGAGEDNSLRVTGAQVERLEQEIDAMNAPLAPLNSFVLPGGTQASAHLHLARTTVRRAERIACALMEAERVNPLAVQYLNRLSDHLFVLARALNDNGAADVLWEPGVNR
jgi:cob(I)alamin adenosyltransferase